MLEAVDATWGLAVTVLVMLVKDLLKPKPQCATSQEVRREIDAALQKRDDRLRLENRIDSMERWLSPTPRKED